MLSNFTKYVKQIWKNKPDTSSPLNATRLNHIEDGIESNSNAISELDTSVTALTEKKTVTPTPIKELTVSNFKCSVRAGDVKINGQILCSGSSSVEMEHEKVLMTGLPKSADGMIVFHAIPWNNASAVSNDSRTPLRLCITADGKLCAFYPSKFEKITVGMPITVNVSYFTND